MMNDSRSIAVATLIDAAVPLLGILIRHPHHMLLRTMMLSQTFPRHHLGEKDERIGWDMDRRTFFIQKCHLAFLQSGEHSHG